MNGGSLWSAAARSRFGSPLLDSPLPRRLNYSLVRSGCKEANRPDPAKCLGQRIDYQSGSKQPHSKGCRIIIIMVVAFISQRPSTHGTVVKCFRVASATPEFNRR